MPPPSRYFTSSPDMVADLSKVAEVSLDTLRVIAAALGQQTGVLSIPRLYATIESVCSDEDVVRAVGNTVYSLPPDNPDHIVAWLKEVQARTSARVPRLSESVLLQLRDRLAILAVPYPAVERLRKADRLGKMIGSWCRSIELLCDLRPLFDEKRSQIEGMIPLQLLQIKYVDQNGEDAYFEVGLDGDDAELLMEKLRLGKQKLAAMKQSCEEWVPNGWVGPDEDKPSDPS